MGAPMTISLLEPDLVPFADAPSPGTAIEVAPGLLWLRIALPFRLNHINIYLVADHDGWTLIDTGGGDAPTQALWATLLEAGPEGPLRDRPITRILATHHHPDHVGAAAFLCARTGAPLMMGNTEYLTALLLVTGDGLVRRDFYRRHGLDTEQTERVAGQPARYRHMVPDLPRSFAALYAGDIVQIGTRRFTILELPGHSPAQIILHEPRENILLVSDHVLTRISPNVSVTDRNPEDDPLGRYLASLAHLRETIPDGGLVLPGHHLPFRRLHARTREIETHHFDRCAVIEEACGATKGLTVAELVPILFPFPLDAHQFWFAFSEALAHVNHLARLGRLEGRDSHGRRRWGKVGRRSHSA